MDVILYLYVMYLEMCCLYVDRCCVSAAGVQEAEGLHCDPGPAVDHTRRLLAHDLGAENSCYYDDHKVD